MKGLVGSELLKVRSTRMWVGLLAGACAFVVLNLVAQAFSPAAEGFPGIESEQGVRNVWSSAGTGSIFALVLGILSMTTEFRFQTLSSTFLATPRRSRVVIAKMAALAGVGLVVGLVCAVITVVVAAPLLVLRDAVPLSSMTIAAILVGSLVATLLYAVVGVAIGSLIPNQIAAIVGALVWILLVESLLVAFLPDVGKWLPGGAANSMLQASATGDELLNPWLGALVFMTYAVAFAALAVRTTLHRDVS